jgi:serine/threonine protein kinase
MAADIALPRDYALNEYRIEQTLGVGGFGLTYLATDSNLNLKVAIKEYLPGELALRCDDQSVQPKSDSALDSFKWGLSRFLDESRTLASFRHPNIVRVMRFFEANRTAYMVMEFVAGQSLNEWIRSRRPLDQKAVLGIAHPLLDGLEIIHRARYLHRDIKPNNILIRDDGSPVLLDFGSARMAGDGNELTVIVTPGYAPAEQYHSHGKQGPWSDLYAFGGVLYWMVTGNRTVDAVARIRQDMLPPAVNAADRTRYSTELLAAIDWALTPNEEQRPQTVGEFRNVLPAHVKSEQRTVTIQETARMPFSNADTPSGVKFDHETLKIIEAELARHIGPIAGIVIENAARKAHTVAGLAEIVASEIADDKAHTAFVRKFSGNRTTPASEPSRPTSGRPQSVRQASTESRIDAVTIEKAEASLSKYIGAVARIVVKRAAAKARDPGELYLMIADEIEDKSERKAFIRKAISESGKE